MRFIHLTDPHLTSLRQCRLTTLAGKRWFGYLSWRRKRSRQLRREMLDRLTAAVLAETPAQVAITGDLVHIGLTEEIRAARDWLVGFGPPERVFVVPGNHDVYASDSWAAVARCWGDYLRLESPVPSGDGRAGYPILRELDGVSLIGVSSALPTSLLLATGRLGDAQLARLGDAFRDVRARGGFACLLIHHPPAPGLTHWRKRLDDETALEALLRREQVPVALHGHLHRDRRTQRGETRIYGTAAASSIVAAAPASYRVFDVDRQADGWRVGMTLKRFHEASGDFVTVDEERWLASATVAS